MLCTRNLIRVDDILLQINMNNLNEFCHNILLVYALCSYEIHEAIW